MSKRGLKKHISQGHEHQNPMAEMSCTKGDYQCKNENDLSNHTNVNHIEDSNISTSSCSDAPEVDEAELDEWIAKAEAAAAAGAD